ncbi:ACT domain-containing protein [Candidatus Neptunochlamydia vexilliferae]|nr:ACT domain-containing protein [Candidatus Neptunochlamydia vexilliferae]
MNVLLLILLAEKLTVCQMDQSEPIPPWATQSNTFFSVTLTEDELSIVCPSRYVPKGTKCERDWVAYKVAGPLDFGLTGILASIANPLAAANISLFAISTYDTDYILVKEKDRKSSIETLRKAGFSVEVQ